MKRNLLFLFISLIIITSCKEKNEVITIENPKESIPKIKIIEDVVYMSDKTNDTTIYNYFYDSSSKLEKIISIKKDDYDMSLDSSKFEYKYFRDSIVEIKTRDNETTYFTHLLNNKGLIIKTNNFFEVNNALNDFEFMFSKKKNEVLQFIYKYNEKNQITQFAISIPNIDTTFNSDTTFYNVEYKYDNIKRIYCKVNNELELEYNYLYYFENNCIGKENIIGNFLGKQNKNLVKEYSGFINFFGDYMYFTIKYTYTFNSNKKVETQKMSFYMNNQLEGERIRKFTYTN